MGAGAIPGKFALPECEVAIHEIRRLPGTVFVRFSADVERDHDLDCYSCRNAFPCRMSTGR